MNVAVRTFQHSTLASTQEIPLIVLGSKQLVILLLGLIILVTAFSVVFVRDMNRQMMSQLQALESTQNGLHNEWSQLLLEDSTWASQARIEQVATQKLNMVMPKAKYTIVLDA